jgi:hypothetical protein
MMAMAAPDNVTLIFSRSATLGSWLIRQATGSSVSHCGIGFRWAGWSMVADSSLAGVRIMTRHRWRAKRTIVQELVPTAELRPDMSRLMGAMGERYDVGGLFGFLPVLVMTRWAKRKLRNPLADPSAMVCSELVLRCLPTTRIGGVEFDAESTAPSALMEALSRECNAVVADGGTG